ncbi:MAG: hypothetical protein HQ488_00930 [Parcubacteria group bacterium]|nr:hypothetical protein [Parcubacteria group bacterium]
METPSTPDANDNDLPDDVPTLSIESTTKTPVSTETEGHPEIDPEGESSPERSAFQKIGDAFRSKAETFMSMLRGERLPGEDDKKESTKMDKAKFGAKIAFSVYTTIKGYKGAFDAPAWFYQKFFTNPAERKRIKDELEKNIDTEEGEGKPSAVEQKRAQIEAAVQSSKFLSPEKKLELINRLAETVAGHDAELAVLDNERNEAIAQLLDEFITTRVKGTVALKEGVNTALHLAADASGMGLYMRMARTGTYGAVSLYERWQTVANEREAGSDGQEAKRTGSQMSEFMNGFKETKDKLLLKGEGTKGDKFKNFAKASGTVARFIGMSTMGIQAGLETDAGQDALNSMLDKFAGIIPSAEAHGLAHTTETVVGSEVPQDLGATQATDPATMDLSEASIDYSDDFVGPLPEDAAEFVGPLPEDAELVGPVEFDPQQIELGTVHSGDGIIKVLERQMEASPKDFGYEGDVDDAKAVDAWAKSAAVAAARESGLIRDGGDTRLATEAIEKLSVMAKANSEGGVNIVFLDNTTGEHIDLDQVREQGLAYEHGVGLDGATPQEAISTKPTPATGIGRVPARESGTMEKLPELREAEASPDVPHSFMDGQLQLEARASGEFGASITVDDAWYAENQESIKNMLDRETYESHIPERIEANKDITERLVGYKKILEVFDKRGLSDSAEAELLHRRIAVDLRALDIYTEGYIQEDALTELRELAKDVDLSHPADMPTEAIDRINDIRIPGIGKLEFTYSADGTPSMDWKNLSEEIGPGLRKKATGLLTKGWENDYPESRVDFLMEQSTQKLAYMYLREEALSNLISEGHGSTPEADFLRRALTADLRENADILDPDSPAVRYAVRLTGTEPAPLSWEEPTEAPDADATPAIESTPPTEASVESPYGVHREELEKLTDRGDVEFTRDTNPPEATYDGNRSDIDLQLASNGYRIIGDRIVPLPSNPDGVALSWGAQDVDPATGEVLSRTSEVHISLDGDTVTIQAINTDGRIDIVHLAPDGDMKVETGSSPVVEAPQVISQAAPLAEAGPSQVEVAPSSGLEKATFGNTKFELPGEGEVRFTYNADGSVKNVFVPGKWVSDKSLMKEALGEQGLTPRGVTEQFAQEDRGISGYIDGMPVERDIAPLSGGGVSHEARDEAREFMRKTTRLYVERQALDEMSDAGLSGTPEFTALEKDVAGLEEIIDKKYN